VSVDSITSASGDKRCLTIIVPSYNDSRIGQALDSIRRFDDAEVVKILVVDGGSRQEVREIISKRLAAHDIFICEPDEGIFDALNKGLQACDTEFIGWLGSDDLFTGEVTASHVVDALGNHDLFIADVAFVRGGRRTRVSHALPSKLGLMKFGLHNPHYATFGRATLLRGEQFEVGLYASDIDFFLKIFKKRPTIATVNLVATLQSEGGHSNGSLRILIKQNLECVGIFARHYNWLWGPIAVLGKLTYKVSSRVYYGALARPKRLVDPSATWTNRA